MWFRTWFVTTNLALRVSDITLWKVKKMSEFFSIQFSRNYLHAFACASALTNDEWIVYHIDRTGIPVNGNVSLHFLNRIVDKFYLFTSMNKHMLTQERTSFHLLATNYTFEWFSETKIQFQSDGPKCSKNTQNLVKARSFVKLNRTSKEESYASIYLAKSLAISMEITVFSTKADIRMNAINWVNNYYLWGILRK